LANQYPNFSNSLYKIKDFFHKGLVYPYKFVKDGCLFTLLVDDHDRVFGMTLEVLD
jgi:hypothetical protein